MSKHAAWLGLALLVACAAVDQIEPEPSASTASSASLGAGAADPASSSGAVGGMAAVTTGAGASVGGGGTGGAGPPLRVFVTSVEYDGDIELQVMGASSGPDAGDWLCQARADAEALGGFWTAWLSDMDINAIDRITADGPWVLLTGPVVFPDRLSITQVGPLFPINISETGTPLSGGRAWTATSPDGTWSGGADCTGWTTKSFMSNDYGTTGLIQAIDPTWTHDALTLMNCGVGARLYCFEQ